MPVLPITSVVVPPVGTHPRKSSLSAIAVTYNSPTQHARVGRPAALSDASLPPPAVQNQPPQDDADMSDGSSIPSSADPSPMTAYKSLRGDVTPPVDAAPAATSSLQEESTRLSKKRSHEEAAGSAASTANADSAEPDEVKMDSAVVGSSAAAGEDQESSGAAPQRYTPIRTLQNSLFGQVQLAFDNHRQTLVAVKVSHAALVNPKSTSTSASPDAASNAAAIATARSQAGVSVLEDVRREARILRLLLGSEQPPLTTSTIDGATSGLSSALVEAINQPKNAVVVPGSSNPLSIQQQFLNSIAKGKRSIAAFYDEVEAASFHYLISAYVSGGDLFSVLTAQPQHKVSESVARQWMYQLCCSVRYLHAHSIAHLDISLENACLDDKGSVRLIDFGLAAQHPGYAGDRISTGPDGEPIRNASAHIKLVSEGAASECNCPACGVSSETLMATDPALQSAREARVPLSKLRYLCRPICQHVHKPGKLGYLAPELYANQSWDAYKHDVFSLGVILYSMITGRPPFTRPDENADVWFKVIYSGQWLMPQVRRQPPAAIYSSLSAAALNLIDIMLKPQHLRPTIDQVLKHPFFSASHPMNAPPTKEVDPHAHLGFAAQSKSKGLQRSGSQ